MIARRLANTLLPALAALLCGAVHVAPRAHAELPRLVAAHPLYGVLGHYDRDILALERTEATESRPIAGEVRDAGAALRNRTQAAAQQARSVAPDVRADRALENAGLTALSRARNSSDSAMASYQRRLERETAANIAAYAQAQRVRTERAVNARAQELREKELEAAYNLARRNAAAHLTLRLRLSDLYLDRAARARLESKLAALGDGERRAFLRMQSADAITLAEYRNQVERASASAVARMTSSLRAKASANLAMRRQVLHVAATTTGADTPARMTAFRSSYPAAGGGSAVAADFQNANREISNRFQQIGAAAAQSRAATDAQIATLKGERAALYAAIVAQIKEIVARYAEQRHFVIELTAGRPHGGPDVTDAIRAQLAKL